MLMCSYNCNFNFRTKVYSGNKSGYTSVPTLFELCTRVLIENIDGKLFINYIIIFLRCFIYIYILYFFYFCK